MIKSKLYRVFNSVIPSFSVEYVEGVRKISFGIHNTRFVFLLLVFRYRGFGESFVYFIRLRTRIGQYRGGVSVILVWSVSLLSIRLWCSGTILCFPIASHILVTEHKQPVPVLFVFESPEVFPSEDCIENSWLITESFNSDSLSAFFSTVTRILRDLMTSISTLGEWTLRHRWYESWVVVWFSPLLLSLLIAFQYCWLLGQITDGTSILFLFGSNWMQLWNRFAVTKSIVITIIFGRLFGRSPCWGTYSFIIGRRWILLPSAVFFF